MNVKKQNLKNNLIALVLSLLGFAYVVFYIFAASTDVVASDYIRLINYYIEDVTDLKYLLSWEAISRAPFTFLMRFINVKLFSYTVFFDKILGIVGLFIFNFVTVKFILKNLNNTVIRLIASIVATFMSFSLMSWEMILNGTGYPHFITIGLISITYYVFSKFINEKKVAATGAYNNEVSNYEISSNLIKDSTINNIVHNSETNNEVYISETNNKINNYKVSSNLINDSDVNNIAYSSERNTTMHSNGVDNKANNVAYSNEIHIKTNNKTSNKINNATNNKTNNKSEIVSYVLIIFVAIICFLLYYKSDHTGVPLVPVGFKNVSLLDVIKEDILFPIRFLLKSLASSIIGIETISYSLSFGIIDDKIIYLIGSIYVLIILWTVYIITKLSEPAVSANVNCRCDLSAALSAALSADRQDRQEPLRTRETTILGLIITTTLLFAGSYAVAFEGTLILISMVFIIVSLVSRARGYKSAFYNLLYGKTLLPFIYIINGIINYSLVFLARFKFVDDTYGMSSRYSIQYMFLSIGIVIILFIYLDNFFTYELVDKNNSDCNQSHTSNTVSDKIINNEIINDKNNSDCNQSQIGNVVSDKIISNEIINDKNNLNCNQSHIGSATNDKIAYNTNKPTTKNCDYACLSKKNHSESNHKETNNSENHHNENIINVNTNNCETNNCETNNKYIYLNKDALTLKNIITVIVSAICIFILCFGNITTSVDEIYKSGSRKILYENLEKVALNYENLSDDELMTYFEYFRGGDQIRNAMDILKSQKLNIFRDK